MKQQIAIATLLMFVATTLVAQETGTLKGVYNYWGAGVSGESFEGKSRRSPEGGITIEREFRSNVSAELLGFYWPLGDRRTLVGVVSNGAFDGDEMTRASFDLSQFSTSGSVMHFVTDTIGAGLLLRGDIGIAGRRVTMADGEETTTAMGLGTTLGIGYGFTIGGRNIIVGGNVVLRRIGSQNYGGVGGTIGILW